MRQAEYGEEARILLPVWLGIAAVVILLDQLSKFLASYFLILHKPVPVLPFFNLTLAHNRGIAFSLLNEGGSGIRWFLTVTAITVCAVLILWMRRLPRKDQVTALGLSLILGGALGNVIDRMRFGYVVDFIDLYAGNWHWPAFNIADSAITIGAFVLVLTSLRRKQAT